MTYLPLSLFNQIVFSSILVIFAQIGVFCMYFDFFLGIDALSYMMVPKMKIS